MEKINLNNSPMNQITNDEEKSKIIPPDEQIQELE
jgi:hypothetical protein